MKKIRRLIWIPAVGILVLAFLFLLLMSRTPYDGPEVDRSVIWIDTVSRGGVSRYAYGTGNLVGTPKSADLIASLQFDAALTGEVTVKLFKGSSSVVGRTSPHALYSAHLASFDMRGYTPADQPVFGDSRGPSCLHLPNSPWSQSNPVRHQPDFADGVDSPRIRGSSASVIRTLRALEPSYPDTIPRRSSMSISRPARRRINRAG